MVMYCDNLPTCTRTRPVQVRVQDYKYEYRVLDVKNEYEYK